MNLERPRCALAPQTKQGWGGLLFRWKSSVTVLARSARRPNAVTEGGLLPASGGAGPLSPCPPGGIVASHTDTEVQRDTEMGCVHAHDGNPLSDGAARKALRCLMMQFPHKSVYMFFISARGGQGSELVAGIRS